MKGLCLLAVDDESLALSDLTAALQAAEPAAAVHAYTDPTKALEAVRTGEILPDIAFLDIQMRGGRGRSSRPIQPRKTPSGSESVDCLYA